MTLLLFQGPAIWATVQSHLKGRAHYNDKVSFACEVDLVTHVPVSVDANHSHIPAGSSLVECGHVHVSFQKMDVLNDSFAAVHSSSSRF